MDRNSNITWLSTILGVRFQCRSSGDTLNLKTECYKAVARNPECCCEDELQYLPSHLLEELVYYLSPESLISLSTLLENRSIPTRRVWSEIIQHCFGKFILQEKLRPERYHKWAAFKVGEDFWQPKQVFLAQVLSHQLCAAGESLQHFRDVTSLRITSLALYNLVERNSDNIAQIMHENLVNLHLSVRGTSLQLSGMDTTLMNFITNAVYTGRLRSLRLDIGRTTSYTMRKFVLDIVENLVAFEKASGVAVIGETGLSIGKMIMNMEKKIKLKYHADETSSDGMATDDSDYDDHASDRPKGSPGTPDEPATDSSDENDEAIQEEIDLFDEAVTNVSSNSYMNREMEDVQQVIRQLLSQDTDALLRPKHLPVTMDTTEQHRATISKHPGGIEVSEMNGFEGCAIKDTLTASRKQDGGIAEKKTEGTMNVSNLESFSWTMFHIWSKHDKFKKLLANWQSLSRLYIAVDVIGVECLSNVIAVKIGCRQLTHCTIASESPECDAYENSIFSKLMFVFFENYREDSGVNQPMEYLAIEAMTIGTELSVCQYNCDVLAVKRLEVRDCYMTEEASANLIHFLTYNRCLIHLNLSNLELMLPPPLHDAPIPIVEILYKVNQSTRFLDTLILEGLKLLTTDDFDAAMVMLLRETGSLQQLALSSCCKEYTCRYRPSDELLQAIGNHSNLKYVALRESNMAEVVDQFLYKCMSKSNPSPIRSLDLRDCLIHGRDLIAVLKRLKGTRNMKQPFYKLDISKNQISRDEQRVLQDMLRTSIEALHIEISGDEHAEFVAVM